MVFIYIGQASKTDQVVLVHTVNIYMTNKLPKSLLAAAASIQDPDK